MRQLLQSHVWRPLPESIGEAEASGELKHLSSPRQEINRDSRSSGERTGSSPNRVVATPDGVVGPATPLHPSVTKSLEHDTTAGERPVVFEQQEAAGS